MWTIILVAKLAPGRKLNIYIFFLHVLYNGKYFNYIKQLDLKLEDIATIEYNKDKISV